MKSLTTTLICAIAVSGVLLPVVIRPLFATPPIIPPRYLLHVGPHQLVHPANVESFDMTDDGRLIATGCGVMPYKGWGRGKVMPCGLRVWDSQTGWLIHHNRDHQYTPTWVAFSPNGKLLASATDWAHWPYDASAEKDEPGSIMVAVRSTVSGRRLWEMRASRYLLSTPGSFRQPTRFRRVSDNPPPPLPRWEYDQGCLMDFRLLWSSDSQFLAALSKSMFVSVLQAETGRQFSIFGGQALGPLCVQFGRHNQILYTLDTNGEIRGWNLKTGREEVSHRRSLRQAGILDIPKTRNVYSFPRASLCAVRVVSGIYLLNLELDPNVDTARRILDLDVPINKNVELRLSDDHRKLAVCSGMHVRVVDVESGDSGVVLRLEKAFRHPIRAWFLPNSHELAFVGETGLKKIAAAP